MKPIPGSEPPFSPGERSLCSIRTVIARACDVLWQSDPSGAVTNVTACRPALPEGQGQLEETEVAQVEQLWNKAVRCAERLSAVYQCACRAARRPSFLVQAVPVFNDRDEVLCWSGHATEVESFADAGTRFISEATGVLASSLNRAAIVNRFIDTAVKHFSDVCSIHTLTRTARCGWKVLPIAATGADAARSPRRRSLPKRCARVSRC